MITILQLLTYILVSTIMVTAVIGIFKAIDTISAFFKYWRSIEETTYHKRFFWRELFPTTLLLGGGNIITWMMISTLVPRILQHLHP